VRLKCSKFLTLVLLVKAEVLIVLVFCADFDVLGQGRTEEPPYLSESKRVSDQMRPLIIGTPL
jgi:hypothetical protein